MNKEKELKQQYQLLVKQYHGDLYRYGYWLTNDKQVTEDLVQETFLRAWRAIDQLADINAAKSWLITILRRENARRFERKQLSLVDIDDCEIADEQDTTSTEIENDELRQAIEMLAPEYKEPLVLQALLGFSGDEISKQLGLNKNTVMTRLFRAKKQLANLLMPKNAGQ
ncbi:sigma-70 family RNA polymerase sigma factor [Psychrobium sp. 1_MG-2023]|uniref:sigma-70 family RNA polymerase sigma factor n=1 Tax=Psychrobium sp. 1_MG-2023 TaxID=3062624 RepID=UPI000C31BA9D|nr:sigma-70 family RNA polymerase sigma factor [Psychrobium sp. 1_MG-2023]MDP2561740.1 sigma-70 family RNA polymerase sigma factor [Psychrobium sp. 1_MG-2023]PKF59771.1 RNA polymerase subunit sigma [Alteromonadales bacterium alter-6D02]